MQLILNDKYKALSDSEKKNWYYLYGAFFCYIQLHYVKAFHKLSFQFKKAGCPIRIPTSSNNMPLFIPLQQLPCLPHRNMRNAFHKLPDVCCNIELKVSSSRQSELCMVIWYRTGSTTKPMALTVGDKAWLLDWIALFVLKQIIWIHCSYVIDKIAQKALIN